MKYKYLSYLFLLLCIVCCKNKSPYEERTYYANMERHVEDDGFIWYSFSKDSLQGALNKNKQIIIEANARSIVYEHSCFTVYYPCYTKDNKMECIIEVRNQDGEVLIPKDRLYNQIHYEEVLGTNRYYYEIAIRKNGKLLIGICDKTGEEVVPPVYDLICVNKVEEKESPFREIFRVWIDNSVEYLYAYFDDEGLFNSYGKHTKYYIKEVDKESYTTGLKDNYSQGKISELAVFDDFCFHDKTFYKKVTDENDLVHYERLKDDYEYVCIYEEYNKVYVNDACNSGWITEYLIMSDSYNKKGVSIKNSREEYFRNLKSKFLQGDYDSYYSMTNGEEYPKNDYSDVEYNSNGNIYNSNVPANNVMSTGNNLSNVSSIENKPTRKPCSVCKQTGKCPACKGTGQIMSAMSLASDHTVYQSHSYCNGTGICPACKGDGWYDEGIDF